LTAVTVLRVRPGVRVKKKAGVDEQTEKQND
jgi:hypothetical protein